MKNYIYFIARRGVIISDVTDLSVNDWLPNNVIPGREKWHHPCPFEVNNKGPTTKYFPTTSHLFRPDFMKRRKNSDKQKQGPHFELNVWSLTSLPL